MKEEKSVSVYSVFCVVSSVSLDECYYLSILNVVLRLFGVMAMRELLKTFTKHSRKTHIGVASGEMSGGMGVTCSDCRRSRFRFRGVHRKCGVHVRKIFAVVFVLYFPVFSFSSEMTS